MRLLINDQAMSPPGEIGTLGALLEWLEATATTQGHILSELTVDGVPLMLSTDDLRAVSGEVLSRFREVTAHLEDVDSATERGLASVTSNLVRLKRLAESIPTAHRQGDHDTASEKFLIVVEAFSALLRFLSLCEERLSDPSGGDLRERLGHLCLAMESAQERRLWLDLSRLMTEELVPLIDQLDLWANRLRAVLSRGSSVDEDEMGEEPAP